MCSRVDPLGEAAAVRSRTYHPRERLTVGVVHRYELHAETGRLLMAVCPPRWDYPQSQTALVRFEICRLGKSVLSSPDAPARTESADLLPKEPAHPQSSEWGIKGRSTTSIQRLSQKNDGSAKDGCTGWEMATTLESFCSVTPIIRGRKDKSTWRFLQTRLISCSTAGLKKSASPAITTRSVATPCMANSPIIASSSCGAPSTCTPEIARPIIFAS